MRCSMPQLGGELSQYVCWWEISSLSQVCRSLERQMVEVLNCAAIAESSIVVNMHLSELLRLLHLLLSKQIRSCRLAHIYD